VSVLVYPGIDAGDYRDLFKAEMQSPAKTLPTEIHLTAFPVALYYLANTLPGNAELCADFLIGQTLALGLSVVSFHSSY